MQRLPRQQHHVVGDVDHIRDRALAGCHQARLQPQGARTELDLVEDPRCEARTQLLGGLDGDGGAFWIARLAGIGLPRRRLQRRARRSVELARDPVDPEAVRAVGRYLEDEDVGRDRKDARERSASVQVVLLQHDDLAVGRADRQLVLGEDHSARVNAPHAAVLER